MSERTRYQSHVKYTTKHDRPGLERDYTLEVEHSTAARTYDSDVPHHTEIFRVRAWDGNMQPLYCDGTNRTAFDLDIGTFKYFMNDDRTAKQGHAGSGAAPIAAGNGIPAFKNGKGYAVTDGNGTLITDNDGFVEFRFIPKDGKPMPKEQRDMLLAYMGIDAKDLAPVPDHVDKAEKAGKRPGGHVRGSQPTAPENP